MRNRTRLAARSTARQCVYATPDIGNTRRFVSILSFDLPATELEPRLPRPSPVRRVSGASLLPLSHSHDTTAFLSLRLRRHASLPPSSFSFAYPRTFLFGLFFSFFLVLFYFGVSTTNNEAFNEPTPRLLRHTSAGSSRAYLPLFSVVAFFLRGARAAACCVRASSPLVSPLFCFLGRAGTSGAAGS